MKAIVDSLIITGSTILDEPTMTIEEVQSVLLGHSIRKKFCLDDKM